jgi:predicted neutral ceramidase superfamily lipid hydrolase
VATTARAPCPQKARISRRRRPRPLLRERFGLAPLRIRPQLARLHGTVPTRMTLNANLKGALLMTASMGSFTLNDVFVKLLAEDMPLFQIVFLRSVLTAILLTIAAAAMGQLRLRPGPGDRARLAWRTVFEIATMVAFLYALVNMPIANATAILAALPLSVTLAAAVFLGSRWAGGG